MNYYLMFLLISRLLCAQSNSQRALRKPSPFKGPRHYVIFHGGTPGVLFLKDPQMSEHSSHLVFVARSSFVLELVRGISGVHFRLIGVSHFKRYK